MKTNGLAEKVAKMFQRRGYIVTFSGNKLVKKPEGEYAILQGNGFSYFETISHGRVYDCSIEKFIEVPKNERYEWINKNSSLIDTNLDITECEILGNTSRYGYAFPHYSVIRKRGEKRLLKIPVKETRENKL